MRAMATVAHRRALDRVRTACEDADAPVPLLRDAVAALGPALRVDAWCGLTLDPVTLLPTGGDHRDGLPQERMPRLLELEYGGEDVMPFAALSRSRTGAETMAAATGGRPETSPRYRDVLAPSDLPHELRVALRAGGRAWGALVLLRARDAAPFAGDEVEAASALGAVLGAGLRRSLVVEAARTAPAAAAGPAVLVLVPGDPVTVETAVPALPDWRALVPDGEDARAGVPIAVLAVAHAALDAPGGTTAARMRTRAGRWSTVHATSLDRRARRVAVVMEPTRPHEVLQLLMDAHGLTAREQEVVPLALRGLSNGEIAERLVVSPWTAQDHLRNVFRKLGVSGRAALAARLFFDHYLPLAPDGRVPVGADGTPVPSA